MSSLQTVHKQSIKPPRKNETVKESVDILRQWQQMLHIQGEGFQVLKRQRQKQPRPL